MNQQAEILEMLAHGERRRLERIAPSLVAVRAYIQSQADALDAGAKALRQIGSATEATEAKRAVTSSASAAPE